MVYVISGKRAISLLIKSVPSWQWHNLEKGKREGSTTILRSTFPSEHPSYLYFRVELTSFQSTGRT